MFLDIWEWQQRVVTCNAMIRVKSAKVGNRHEGVILEKKLDLSPDHTIG